MKEFSNTHILKLLHIIHYRLSIDSLVEVGLEYSQIAKLLSNVLENGLVEDLGEKGLKLTADGVKLLENLNKELNPLHTNVWVLPSDENRIPKIDKFDIYLPRKKKSVE
jgi:hypothetical protein